MFLISLPSPCHSLQYLLVCHVANLTPGGLRGRLGGATGHSQGIISAVVIATPSPMLSVTGLALKDLEVHITNTNNHLPDGSQFQISLRNGSKAFVVTGLPKGLFSLVTSLRKVKESSGLDQGKIPFSQRKPVFSIRFLVVGVPYHRDYISGVTDTVVEEDLEDEELWEVEDLKIPVYSTEDGEYGLGSHFGIHI